MWKIIASLLLVCCAFTAHASIISDDQFIGTDQVDLSELDWLSLDLTLGLTYEAAVTAGADTIEGGGWRVASAGEVSNLFNSLGWDDPSGSGIYPPNLNWWENTFGWTYETSTSGGLEGLATYSERAYAMYEADDGTVSSISVGRGSNGISFRSSYDLNFDLDILSLDSRENYVSTLLVRGEVIPPVPIPAGVWLFGTALIGLVGFSKRRKAA